MTTFFQNNSGNATGVQILATGDGKVNFIGGKGKSASSDKGEKVTVTEGVFVLPDGDNTTPIIDIIAESAE